MYVTDTVLPKIVNFYNDLSKEDYCQAQTVWRELKLQNMREFALLYLVRACPGVPEKKERERKETRPSLEQ